MNYRGGSVHILVALMLTAPSLTAVQACMCSITHPQQKFCTAELVMTGRMENMEWILIPELIPTEKALTSTEMHSTAAPTTTTMLEFISASSTDRENSTLTDGQDRPHQLNSTQGLTGEDVGGVVGVRSRGPPQRHRDDPSTHSHENRPTGSKGSVISQPQSLRINPSPREVAMMEPRNYNVLYEIEVDKVYKQSSKFPLQKKEMVRLLAPPPQRHFPMCSYSAMRRKRLYLFAIQNSDMMTACDWVEEFRSLSKNQKQGIKSAYARSCDICQIYLNPSGMLQHNTELVNNATCIAEMDRMMIFYPDYMRSDCYAMFSHCAMRKGQCKWYSSKDFKKCKNKDKSGQQGSNEGE